MNVQDFIAKKRRGERISMVTCYDAWSARLIAGRPSMGKQTLWRSAERMRVPLPPARMIEYLGTRLLISSPFQ